MLMKEESFIQNFLIGEMLKQFLKVKEPLPQGLSRRFDGEWFGIAEGFLLFLTNNFRRHKIRLPLILLGGLA